VQGGGRMIEQEAHGITDGLIRDDMVVIQKKDDVLSGTLKLLK
jgi:hypothetical protein